MPYIPGVGNVMKNPRRPISVVGASGSTTADGINAGIKQKFPGLSRADDFEAKKVAAWKKHGKQVPLAGLLKVVRNAPGMKQLRSAENDERLRFLREQLRQGRLSTVLSVAGGKPGQGFQLGKKSVLGETA